jgi:hypothetical protein
MAWIFEPQRNIADEGDTETMHVPCSLADATVVAVFEGDAGDAEPEYVGDVSADAFRSLLASAKA